MKNTFTPSLLQECCIRDRAELLETYEKTNRNSRIHFQCCCGNGGIKGFREIVEKGGLFCKECVKLNFKTKLQNTWSAKDRETLDIINERRKITMIEVLGVDNATKSEVVQNKRKQTSIEKYGVDNASKSDLVKDKIKKAYNEKSLDERNKINEKRKVTCLEMYGCISSAQNNDVKIKAKQTFLKNYGCQSPLQNEEIKYKIKATCLAKYGVEHPLQDPIIFSKHAIHTHKWKDYVTPFGKILRIQGYEHFALDKLFEIYVVDDIIIGSDVPEIWYKLNGKVHRYHCDIFIKSENLIIEVKSKYTYNKSFGMNQAKQKACLDAGYNFEFWIYNEKGVRVNNETMV
jgi:hypothetical protein